MSERQGLRVRKLADYNPASKTPKHIDHLTGEPSKYPLLGVVFVDEKNRNTVDGDPNGDPVPAPKMTRIMTDYAARESWIELVNPRPVVKPAGRPDDPWGKPPHVFMHADEIVLHMLNGDVRYAVVGQPDKYDADGNATDRLGDPTTEVRWFYDVDLIEE